MNVALFGAMFLGFPFIATQIYCFVAPGLYKKERNAFIPYLIATPVFFLLGAAMVYFVVCPMALHFFLGMQQTRRGQVKIELQTRVSEYLGFIMTLIFAFGICFQLPVVLTLLARIELVNIRARSTRAAATPSSSSWRSPPSSRRPIRSPRSASRLPMYALYELSIILSVEWVEKRRAPRSWLPRQRRPAEGLSSGELRHSRRARRLRSSPPFAG